MLNKAETGPMRVYFWDIDGTLLSSGSAGARAMFGALEELHGDLPDMSHISFGGRTDRGIMKSLLQEVGAEDTAEARQKLGEAYLKRLPAAISAAGTNYGLLPGISTIIEALLAQENAAIGLLTGNMLAGARRKLESVQLNDPFPFGGFGDDHEERGLVAEQALTAAEAYFGHAIDPQNCWILGDTIHDIDCARHVGAKALAVATGRPSRDELGDRAPDALFDDLSDVDEVLRVLTT